MALSLNHNMSFVFTPAVSKFQPNRVLRQNPSRSLGPLDEDNVARVGEDVFKAQRAKPVGLFKAIGVYVENVREFFAR